MRDLFSTVLHTANDSFRLKNIEMLNKAGFKQDSSETDIIEALLLKDSINPLWSDFDTELDKLLRQLKIKEPERRPEIHKVDFMGISIRFTIPEVGIISLHQSIENAVELIPFMNYIDFMFIFASIMYERTVIFVSEDRKMIGQAVQLFTCLLNPFNWPYPVIYSMPENCLDILGSPVPLIAGLLAPAKKVAETIVPEYAAMSRETVYVFLDERYILASKEVVSNTIMPRLNKTIKTLHENIKNLFASTSSQALSLNSKTREFSRKSSSVLPKKHPQSPSKRKIDMQAHTFLKSYFEGLEKCFNESFMVKDPDNQEQSEKEIRDRLGPKDQQFLDSFLKSQTFSFSISALKSNSP